MGRAGNFRAESDRVPVSESRRSLVFQKLRIDLTALQA